MERWPADGVPSDPVAWIIRVGRNRAIDRIRREATLAEKTGLLQRDARDVTEADVVPAEVMAAEELPDDRLRLIFTACHPALAPEARIALTLRTLGGLTTAEIARAFLTSEATMAQRLVRAKRKIRDAGIPYEVPDRSRIGDRLASVLSTLYLVFNEGYAASSTDELVRRDLCTESIRLATVLREMLPGESEVAGLLALMVLHDARKDGRADENGQLVLLADQDRSLWDRDRISAGLKLVNFAMGRPGPYGLQAAIAAEHARAAAADDTDWLRIRVLYDYLAIAQPSPVVSLNRAVAVAMASGAGTGLKELDRIEGLDGYVHFHSARGDLLGKLGRWKESAAAYERTLQLATGDVERAFFQQRLREARGKS